jgi:hypothetical protein
MIGAPAGTPLATRAYAHPQVRRQLGLLPELVSTWRSGLGPPSGPDRRRVTGLPADGSRPQRNTNTRTSPIAPRTSPAVASRPRLQDESPGAPAPAPAVGALARSSHRVNEPTTVTTVPASVAQEASSKPARALLGSTPANGPGWLSTRPSEQVRRAGPPALGGSAGDLADPALNSGRPQRRTVQRTPRERVSSSITPTIWPRSLMSTASESPSPARAPRSTISPRCHRKAWTAPDAVVL